MELNSLRYFVCVANYLSFSRAAEHLYISQPALSYHISNLEKELGVSLFIREKRHIALTEAGKILLEEADQVCSHVNAAFQRVAQLTEASANTLRFGFVELLITPCFNHFISPFLLQNPQFHGVTERCSNLHLLDELLLKNSYDFVFSRKFLCDLYRDPKQLATRTVMRDCVSIIVPSSYPCSQYKSIRDLSPLSEYKLLMLDQSVAGDCYDPCFKTLLSAHGYFSAPHDCAVRNMDDLMGQVAAGRGFSIVPFYHTIPLSYHGAKLIRLEGDDVPNADIVLAWNHSSMTPSKEQFLSFINTHFQQPFEIS